jgi:hypothetical protein
MERRSSQRIITGYKTEIFCSNNSLTGIIENLSASGVYVLTDPVDSEIKFLPNESIELKFKAHTGKDVILKCTLMWSSKIPPHNVRHRIGMKILEMPWDKFDYFL